MPDRINAEQIAAIYAHYRAGLTQRDIAAKVGTSNSTVRRHIEYAIEHGALDRRPGANSVDPVSLLKNRGIQTGTMLRVLFGMTRAEQEWAIRNIPAGGCLSDLLLLLVRDACTDDLENRKDTP